MTTISTVNFQKRWKQVFLPVFYINNLMISVLSNNICYVFCVRPNLRSFMNHEYYFTAYNWEAAFSFGNMFQKFLVMSPMSFEPCVFFIICRQPYTIHTFFELERMNTRHKQSTLPGAIWITIQIINVAGYQY